ncbi:MAG: phosphoribosyl-ATP diphosphatase [Alphaproteobacteria bacterium]
MNKVLDELFETIKSRKGGNVDESWTAKLLDMGTDSICEKVIEEAEETVAEAMAKDNDKLTYESADLLYHLMVLWADRGINPEDVLKELQRRQGVSGIEEKQSR